jgi:hypothetical protein
MIKLKDLQNIIERVVDRLESLIVEDWGLLQTIREGETTDTVTRAAVFDVLEAIQ